MQAAEALQFLVAERLHAVAEAIDACVAEAGEPRRRDRFRVRLHRDFGVGRHVERAATRLDDRPRSPTGSSSDGVPPPK